MIRQAVVAGQFYSGTSQRLQSEVQSYILKDRPYKDVIAAVCPHAGFMFSGHVAGAVYSYIAPTDTFLLLGPNHTGLGSKFAIMSKGLWQTPLGDMAIDEGLASTLKQLSTRLTEDSLAHLHEHSLEVQLPFIKYLFGQCKIVPITIMKASVDECQTFASEIVNAIKAHGDKRIVIVASTDMSHYVTDTVARQLDALAIKNILELDPEGLYQTVYQNRISMCGVIPTVIMLFAAKQLGASKAELIKYATSGEINYDMQRVVGYAGVVIS